MKQRFKRLNSERSRARKSCLDSQSRYSGAKFYGRIEDSVREDLEILRKSPWIKEGTQLVGLKYEIESGKLSVVE